MSKVYEIIRLCNYESDDLIGRFSSRAKAEAHIAKGKEAEEYWADESIIRVERLLPIDDLVDHEVFRVFQLAMTLNDGQIHENHNKAGFLILDKPFREQIYQDVFRASCFNSQPAIRVRARTEAGCIRVANKFREKWLKEQKWAQTIGQSAPTVRRRMKPRPTRWMPTRRRTTAL